MNFLLSFYSLFFLVLFHYIKKKKKNSVAGLFLFAIFAVGIHFQWIENFKASSSGSVGKLIERKWNTHMESNTVRRVTLELT